MTAASVTIAAPASDGFRRAQHAVWASLPMSLTQAPAKTQLVAVDGQSKDWAGTLTSTIRSGAAGVLVVRPAAGPPAADIRAAAVAAADAGTIVAVQPAWAADPAVAPFARAVTGQLANVTLIDSVVELGGIAPCRWEDVLLGQLALVRAVTGPLELAPFTAQFAARHEDGYTVDGAAGASTVALAAVRSVAASPAVRLAAYGATADAHLGVPGGGVGRGTPGRGAAGPDHAGAGRRAADRDRLQLVRRQTMTWFPDVHVPALRGGPVLRWGVLAPGAIATDFTATVLANTDQRITAVASRSAERAEQFASRHGISHACGSYQQLVADPDVDVVYVAAPHSEHRALSLLAIAAGKHVLIEKPITVSAAEAEEIAAAARAAGVMAAEAMWTRYLPQFDVISQLLERGDLGQIRLATAEVGWQAR